MVEENSELGECFREIKQAHRRAIIERAARVVLGASVLRVFANRTAGSLRKALAQTPIDRLTSFRTRASFERWFVRQLARVARTVRLTNQTNSRIRPGDKWGHAAKVLCLFLREVVLNSRYFRDNDTTRIQFLLHAPVDGIVLRHMRLRRVRGLPRRIRDIDCAEAFYRIQATLEAGAAMSRVPRVWFDDMWLERE